MFATDDDLQRLANEYENFLITLGLINNPNKLIRIFQIRKGESFTEENLTVKRAGTGISPTRWDEAIKQVELKKTMKRMN